MPGCPSCGSGRLKGSPLLLVSPIAELLLSRRHYQCSACGWHGWRHRLRRVGKPTSLVDNPRPPARAMLFFGILIGLLITASLMLLRSCAPWERLPTAMVTAATGRASASVVRR